MADTIEKTASHEHTEVPTYEDGVAVHTDTFDISPEALGVNLPENPYYYRDPKFLGVVVVSREKIQPHHVAESPLTFECTGYGSRILEHHCGMVLTGQFSLINQRGNWSIKEYHLGGLVEYAWLVGIIFVGGPFVGYFW